MVRKPPSSFSLGFAAGSVLAFVLWTLLVVHETALARLDAALDPPVLDPTSVAGQVANAIAVLSWPPVVWVVVLGLALWSHQHRLRNLAGGLTLSVPIGLAAIYALKLAIGRSRPADAVALFTSDRLSYPSGHLAAITAAVIGVGATFTVTRQRRAARIRWGVGGLLIVLLVGLNRLLLGADRATDLIGGLLLGAAVASLSLLITGVAALPRHLAYHGPASRSLARRHQGAGTTTVGRWAQPGAARSSTTRSRSWTGSPSAATSSTS